MMQILLYITLLNVRLVKGLPTNRGVCADTAIYNVAEC